MSKLKSLWRTLAADATKAKAIVAGWTGVLVVVLGEAASFTFLSGSTQHDVAVALGVVGAIHTLLSTTLVFRTPNASPPIDAGEAA